MDNSRDFRIKQSVWVQAVEVYKEMEKELKAEKDKQKGNLTYTKKYWQGAAADTMYSAMNGFLDTGDYAKAYEQVQKMRVFLEEALPDINALLVRCEGFREQLNSDSYVEPVRPAAGNNTEHNGGILALNYDRIAMIKNLCNEIEAENRSLRYELEGIMDSCSGSVDGMQEELGVASAKLNRVANYHDSFQRYEHDIRGLEEQMILELRPLISNIVKARLDSRGMTVGNASTKLEDAYNLAYLSDEELRALVEQFTKVDDTEAMQVVANQIFAKDAGEWSDAEAAFIAQTFDYLLRCDNTQLIQSYLQNMWVESYSAPECADVSYYTGTPTKYTADYQVQPDTQMLALLMAQLDPAIQGEAYYTLNRIAKMQMDSVSVSLSPSAVQNPSGGANLVTVQTVNGAVQINVLVGTQAQNAYGVNAKDSQVITVWDLGAVSGKRLADLGLSEEQIEAMRLSVLIDDDAKLMTNLFAGSYKEAFDVPIANLGADMKTALGYYGIELGRLLEDGCTELEDLVNGIVYTDEERCYMEGYRAEDYLEMMTVQTGVIREMYTALMLSGDLTGEEVRNYSANINEMYSFWYSLYEVMDEGDIKTASNNTELWYSRGDCAIKLSDIEKDGTDMTYNLNLYVNDSSSAVIKTMSVASGCVMNPNGTDGVYGLWKSKQIQEEIDTLWMSQAWDTTIGLLTIYSPAAGSIIKTAADQLNGVSMSEFLSDGSKIPAVKNQMNSYSSSGALLLQKLVGYAENKKKLENEKASIDKENMLRWFYSANQYTTDGSLDNFVYISDGIYNYDVIQGIRRWSENGVGFLLVDETQEQYADLTESEMEAVYRERNKAVLRDVKDGATYNYNLLDAEVKDAVLYMILGKEAKNEADYGGGYNSVLEISNEIFIQAAAVIDTEIKERSDCNSVTLNQLWINECTGVGV